MTTTEETAGGTGQLVLRRGHDTAGRFRRLTVLVDGRQVATLRPGGTHTEVLPAGPHVLRATMDSVRSPDLAFDILQRQPTEIEVTYPYLAGLLDLFRGRRQSITARVIR